VIILPSYISSSSVSAAALATRLPFKASFIIEVYLSFLFQQVNFSEKPYNIMTKLNMYVSKEFAKEMERRKVKFVTIKRKNIVKRMLKNDNEKRKNLFLIQIKKED